MSQATAYQPNQIEPKWQDTWFNQNVFSSQTDASKPKYYVLEMLPYPSGQLHMGHVRNYTLGDVLARFKRAAGYNVLYPMGWDAFGLPAENAALKRKVHPGDWTMNNVADMKTTMKQFGWSYDWDRELATCTPEYYKHQQALFTDMLDKGLAYRKQSIVNWDPIENTVLANEQVVNGKGWRSGVPVERRTMHQWHFKITDYTQELLDDIDKLDEWPERVKTMQRNWLGRSEGLKFAFHVNGWDQQMEVYTTRPDTIYGCTFCAIAPEHPLAKKEAEQNAEAQTFIEECSGLGTSEEAIEKAEKRGFKTSFTAVHPLTKEELPIYIANFVLMSYGTGAVMAVPAHDARDNEFAKKYNLPTPVVERNRHTGEATGLNTYTQDDILENSEQFNGMNAIEAKEAVIQHFEKSKIGKRCVNWRLRDWGISRQRYWGCPIPVVHCDDCGVVPVPKEQLPVELPQDVMFDKAGNPLENHPTWKDTTCPSCGKNATRETDTMDTFVDSSWYFLRYICPQSGSPLEKSDVDYWMGTKATDGVDQYIGGIEHAVLHLLYARFFTKVLRDLGYVSIYEPFKALLCQGMVIGNTYQNAEGEYIYPAQVKWEDGKAFHKETNELLKVTPAEKISKSKNNGDAPDELVAKYGADTLRLYILFTAPPEKDLEWSETAIEGAWRFLNRVWSLVERVQAQPTGAVPAMESLSERAERDLLRKIHQTVRKVTTDIEKFQYNTMVAAVMELTNALQAVEENASANMQAIQRFGVETMVRLLNPACPHITEELWQNLSQTEPLHSTNWPTYDAEIAKDEEITLVVQVNGKLKAKLQVAADITEDDAKTQAKQAVADQLVDLTIRKEIYVPGRLVNMVAN
ncbi:MAG: leucine--tRNA ligase [Alphaproteobacteria bacterium]|nr:leucine--tRNA ligase [Alphaproteobacteria bacterium]MDD9919806.1 leucine--tRNA ligase [Alphaproteobacteria bacterium]